MDNRPPPNQNQNRNHNRAAPSSSSNTVTQLKLVFSLKGNMGRGTLLRALDHSQYQPLSNKVNIERPTALITNDHLCLQMVPVLYEAVARIKPDFC